MCNYSLHHSPLISLLDESIFLATELTYFGKCLQGCRRQQRTETLPLPTPDTGLPGGIRKVWAYWQKWGRRGCWRQGETSDHGICVLQRQPFFFSILRPPLSLSSHLETPHLPPGPLSSSKACSAFHHNLNVSSSRESSLTALARLSCSHSLHGTLHLFTYPSCRTCKSHRPLQCKLQREQ